jgi:hypothetical protein
VTTALSTKRTGGLDASEFLSGAITEGELHHSVFATTLGWIETARASDGEVLRAETPAVEGTKEKTCKPTRNPCCKEDVEVEGTKEKTCKPTRNPCCKEGEVSADGSSPWMGYLASDPRRLARI